MKTETKPKPKLPKIPDAPESRAPALAAEAWPVDRPKPYAKNPRRNDAAVEKVAASIREFGWAQPIVVDGDGVIIIGHTRLKAAKKLGLKTVPVLVRADLSPEQAAALRLADNKTAELAEWDEPLLAAELDALVGAVDMEQFGFDLSAPELTEGEQEAEDDFYTKKVDTVHYEPKMETPPPCCRPLRRDENGGTRRGDRAGRRPGGSARVPRRSRPPTYAVSLRPDRGVLRTRDAGSPAAFRVVRARYRGLQRRNQARVGSLEGRVHRRNGAGGRGR